MNTICKFADIDIYLLYYLDIKTIIRLSTISKDQHTLINSLDFINEIYSLEPGKIDKTEEGRIIPFYDEIIDEASSHNYISLIKWIDASVNKFIYSRKAIDNASTNGHINILDWFDKSPHEFKYSKYGIRGAIENDHIDVLI